MSHQGAMYCNMVPFISNHFQTIPAATRDMNATWRDLATLRGL
jgi:hypothetical protein